MESRLVNNIERFAVNQLVVNVLALHNQIKNFIPTTANSIMQCSVTNRVLKKNTEMDNWQEHDKQCTRTKKHLNKNDNSTLNVLDFFTLHSSIQNHFYLGQYL
jgi:hypothetical protein